MRHLPALLALATLSAMPLAPAAHAEDALQLVKQAAENYAKDVRGVIGYRSQTESRISAPILNQSVSSTSFMIQKDGVPVRVVMERMVTNGKEASRDELSKQEAQTNAGFKGGKGFFKAPYDARHMASYTFTLENCDGCAPGSTAIRFTSAVKDDQHGKGLMILDSQQRVREVRYTPNVYPPNVTRGELTLIRDEVGKDMTGLTGLKADYQGAMGLIKGSFVMNQRNTAFRRYSSVDEALAQTETQASKP